jgi:hypothetical protein
MDTPHPHSRREWSVGYLRSEIGGFANGRVTLAAVQGAARVAIACGVTHVEVAILLGRADLMWIETTRAVAQPLLE